MTTQNLVQKLAGEKISPAEMENLMQQVEDFYKQRPNEFTIFQLANLILRRLKSDRDFFMSFEGMRGTGKSNLMILLQLVICRYAGIWRNTDTNELRKVLPRMKPLPEPWIQETCSFEFSKNVSFLDKVEDLQEKFNSIDRFMPFGIDEGSKNLHKSQWQNKVAHKLVLMSDTERYQNKGFFICIPNFNELNKAFRDDRINIRIYLVVRHTNENFAECVITKKDESRWTSDPWHIDNNAKKFEYLLRKRPVAIRTPQDILKAEKKLTGFLSTMAIPNLKTMAPRLWDIYYKHKIDNAKQEHSKDDSANEQKQTKNTQKYKYAIKQLLALAKVKNKITFKDLSELTRMSQVALHNIYREKLEIEDEYKAIDRAKKITPEKIE